jgi:hypothetical protein
MTTKCPGKKSINTKCPYGLLPYPMFFVLDVLSSWTFCHHRSFVTMNILLLWTFCYWATSFYRCFWMRIFSPDVLSMAFCWFIILQVCTGLLPECWVNDCDAILSDRLDYLYLYIPYPVASTVLVQGWLGRRFSSWGGGAGEACRSGQTY